jgi:hypothetical protein
MDLLTFKEKLLNDDLKSLSTPPKLQAELVQKYQDIEVMGTYKLNDSHIGIYFKHKLWHKLAIFRGDDWIETRVNSLKNKLPDETNELLMKNLGKPLSIIRLESVIPVDAVFYFYIIAKMAGKKYVLHVSREGEILLKSKFMDYSIQLDDEDDDDDSDEVIDDDSDDDDDLDDDDIVVEELVVEEIDDEDMD